MRQRLAPGRNLLHLLLRASVVHVCMHAMSEETVCSSAKPRAGATEIRGPSRSGIRRDLSGIHCSGRQSIIMQACTMSVNCGKLGGAISLTTARAASHGAAGCIAWHVLCVLLNGHASCYALETSCLREMDGECPREISGTQG